MTKLLVLCQAKGLILYQTTLLFAKTVVKIICNNINCDSDGNLENNTCNTTKNFHDRSDNNVTSAVLTQHHNVNHVVTDHDDFHSQQPVKGAEDFVRDENREHNCSSSERPALVHDQINMHQDVEVAEYFVSYENREHNCGCFERPAFEHHEIQRQQHPQITQNDFHPDLLRTSYVLTGSTPLNPEISYSLSSEYQSAIYRNRLSRVVFYFYIDDECGLILEFFLFDYYY